MTLVTSAMLSFSLAAAAIAQNEHVMSDTEAAQFWGVQHSQIAWKVVKGPDFDVYYGTAKLPLTGGVGFYWGQNPKDLSDFGATVIEGKLGTYRVRWYRFRREDGTLEQRTQVHFSFFSTWDIWIFSKRQTDIDALVKELSSYSLFSLKTGVRRRNI